MQGYSYSSLFQNPPQGPPFPESSANIAANQILSLGGTCQHLEAEVIQIVPPTVGGNVMKALPWLLEVSQQPGARTWEPPAVVLQVVAVSGGTSWDSGNFLSLKTMA